MTAFKLSQVIVFFCSLGRVDESIKTNEKHISPEKQHNQQTDNPYYYNYRWRTLGLMPSWFNNISNDSKSFENTIKFAYNCLKTLELIRTDFMTWSR